MKLSEEALNKTIKVLIAEKKVISAELEANIKQQSKLFTIGSFMVTRIENLRWGSDRDDYCVEFGLKPELTEVFNRYYETVKFEIKTNLEFAHKYSWSSWSSANMSSKEESEASFKKALMYARYNVEKMELLSEYSNTLIVAKQAVDYYIQNIEPLESKLHSINNQIQEAQNEIENIKKQEEFDISKSILIDGAEFKTVEKFYYTAQKCAYQFKIKANKKGQLYLYDACRFANDKVRAKLTDDLMLRFYKHIIKIIVRKDYDFETGEYVYKKTNNLYTTDESVWETITEEEYNTIIR